MGFIWEFHVGIIALLAGVLALCIIISALTGGWDGIKVSVLTGTLILGSFWLFMMGVGIIIKTARESMLDVDKFYRYKKIAVGLLAILTIAEFLLILFVENRLVVGTSVFIVGALGALIIAFIVYPYDTDVRKAMLQ